jgi:hypothetical protein
MKKWIIAGLVICASVGAAGCGDENTATEQQPTQKQTHKKRKVKKTAIACLESVGYTVERPSTDMIRVKSPSGRPQAILNRGISVDGSLDEAKVGRWVVTFWNDGGDAPNRSVIIDCASKLK